MEFQIDSENSYTAGFYIRLSKEDENSGESQSVRNQRELLRTFAEKYNIKSYEYYIDDGYSGTNFARPSFIRLQKDIENGKINMVVTKDLSRLGRDYIMTGYYTEKFFPEHHVRYISLLDGTDTDADGGLNDITPFRAVLNDMYAKDISKKIKSVKHTQQNKGLFVGGKAPYGYVLSSHEKNKFEVDPIASQVVRSIFEQAAQGRPCRDIAELLNRSSIPPPSVYAHYHEGEKTVLWNSTRVREILKNQVYTGTMVQHKSKRLSYKSKKSIRIPKEKQAIVPHTHTPLVDPATFSSVSHILSQTAQTRLRQYDYLLRGLVYCHECGACMGVINRPTQKSSENLYFICRTYRHNRSECSCHCISAALVTALAQAELRKALEHFVASSDFAHLLQKLRQYHTEHSPMPKQSQMILSQINQKCDRLYNDYCQNLLCEDDFRRLYTQFNREREQYQTLSLLSPKSVPTFCTCEDLRSFILDELPQKQEFLCSAIKRIEISSQREITLVFNFPAILS